MTQLQEYYEERIKFGFKDITYFKDLHPETKATIEQSAGFAFWKFGKAFSKLKKSINQLIN
ncbi:hypothetical protein KAU11_08965 [Candidatus Babeliales bacterium]|nr:hypothetical protein [Candidatus Babeliales bacterium]